VGLAAKIDYFSGDFIGDKYAQEIEEKIKKLKKEHPHPPEN
jgi:nucleolar protein 56